jgi:catechol 2,3-dioxygenase-like lactoylglutathione lyase family enzyme
MPATANTLKVPARVLFCALGVALQVLLPGISLGADAANTPVPVAGIAGVAFLTADFAPLRRFYGEGAGFAEAPSGPGRLRFAVGTTQWIEFQLARAPDWPRRLQYVTLEAPDVGAVERALRARGVPTSAVGESVGSSLQFEDPAADRIRVEGPSVAPANVPRAAGFSTHLQHFGFAVARSQAEATIAFYRDTMGWPVTVRMMGTDGRLDMIKFLLPGSQHEFVELILYDPPLNKWAAGAFDHINFEVTDIDETYRMLHRGGIAVQSRHIPKVNGERFWAIDIMDPELTRMEILDLTPAKEAIGTVSKIESP